MLTSLLAEAKKSRALYQAWLDCPITEDTDDLERETEARYAEGFADGIEYALKQLKYQID